MGNQWLAYKMIQPLMRPVITMNIDNRFMVSKCRARGRKASDPITSRTRNLLQEHRSRRTVALRWRYQRRYFTRVLIPVEVPRFSGRLLSTGAARSQIQSTEMSLPNRNVVRFARATRGYGNQPVIGSIEFPTTRSGSKRSACGYAGEYPPCRDPHPRRTRSWRCQARVLSAEAMAALPPIPRCGAASAAPLSGTSARV